MRERTERLRDFWDAGDGPWDVDANYRPDDAYGDVGAVLARRLRAERAEADAPAISKDLAKAGNEAYALLEKIPETEKV